MATNPNPVVVPVNQDVNLNELGKSGAPNVTNTTTPDITNSPAVKTGASTVLNPDPSIPHVMKIEDHVKNKAKFYDFLVKCLTCGFEARVDGDKKSAEDIANDHVQRKLGVFASKTGKKTTI